MPYPHVGVRAPETAAPFARARELQELSSLDRFRARAVVDWLDVAITTASPTNFQTVQDRLATVLDCDGAPWVQPIDPGPGGATTDFVLRIQDPETFDSLDETIKRLAMRFPLAVAPSGGTWEIAVDFYSKRNERAELEAMTSRLMHTMDAEGKKEIVSGPIPQPLDWVRDLGAGHTLVVGDDDVELHAYLKSTDHNRQPIPDPSLHCARVEVRAPTVVTVGSEKLAALKAFRFESLARYFRFRTICPDAAIIAPIKSQQTVEDVVRARRIQLIAWRGQREVPRPGRNERRKHPRETRADTELKSRCRDALRELTRRFNAEKPGK